MQSKNGHEFSQYNLPSLCELDPRPIAIIDPPLCTLYYQAGDLFSLLRG